jgi:hypothetical protein
MKHDGNLVRSWTALLDQIQMSCAAPHMCGGFDSLVASTLGSVLILAWFYFRHVSRVSSRGFIPSNSATRGVLPI